MFTCTKKYANLPFAHRQPAHPGHCRLIHGHNWAFVFTFACIQLEPGTGFVIDFGGLGWLKEWLNQHFDHTLVLNDSDPCMEFLKLMSGEKAYSMTHASELLPQLAKIIIVPNCSSEGLAHFIFEEVDNLLRAKTGGNVYLQALTVEEDEKNSATYMPGISMGCGHA